MQLSISRRVVVEQNAVISRLGLVVLIALATFLTSNSASIELYYALAAYSMFAALGVWLGQRIDDSWPAYLGAVVDVAMVTALFVLIPKAAVPLWVLYLFPVITAAAASLPAAVTAALLSSACYVLATARLGDLSWSIGWVVGVVVATALVSGLVAGRWFVERAEKRAWRELAAALRSLPNSGEPEDVAAAVVRQARRLVKAQSAWIWWTDSNGRLHLGPVAGGRLPGSLPDRLTPELASGKSLALSELSASGAVAGQVMPLMNGGRALALLAVDWGSTHRSAQRLGARLDIFRPRAAEVLAAAQARVELRERLRRENILSRTVTAMASTFDREMIIEQTTNAATHALNVEAKLVPSSDSGVWSPESRDIEGSVWRAERPAPDSGLQTPDLRLAIRDSGLGTTVPVNEEWALSVRRTGPPLEEADQAWLELLAGAAAAALERSGEYEHLSQEELRLRTTWQQLPGPAGLWDQQGTLVLANEAFEELNKERSLCLEDLQDEEIEIGERPRVFTVRNHQMFGGEYTLSLLSEVTREREALRAKDELISLIGHELRTPLTSIQGYSQMMVRNLAVVQQQVNQLNRLVTDMVDESWLEAGQLPLEMEILDLEAVAQAARERFKGAHPESQLKLEIQQAPSIRGDRSRLGQVLDNLLDNAVKYSPPESPIALVLNRAGSEALIGVRDQGPGIPADQLEHLFERYYRAPTKDAKRVKGLGLGLSIVRELVTAHGGRVWAESEGAGKGSTFWVSLPVSDERQDVEMPAKSEADQVPSQPWADDFKSTSPNTR